MIIQNSESITQISELDVCLNFCIIIVSKFTPSQLYDF